MKRPKLLSLLALCGLTSCTTMHDAAVSTFRVVDAPHQYVRRKLGMDEQDQQTTTTTTQTNVYSDTSAYPPTQPYPVQPGAPPPQTAPAQRQVVTNDQRPASEPVQVPAATPPAVPREAVVQSTPPPPPPPAAAQATNLPYAKPVPGKPGYVFSPYDKNGGYVDVTGYSPGQKVKDPYSGKVFLVP